MLCWCLFLLFVLYCIELLSVLLCWVVLFLCGVVVCECRECTIAHTCVVCIHLSVFCFCFILTVTFNWQYGLYFFCYKNTLPVCDEAEQCFIRGPLNFLLFVRIPAVKKTASGDIFKSLCCDLSSKQSVAFHLCSFRFESVFQKLLLRLCEKGI